MTVEAALGAEMEHHLGYAKSATEGRGTGSSRNGFSPKTLTSPYGELVIEAPRDRNSEFEPVIVQKGQTRLTGFDDQILVFYAQGMTTREITDTFKKLYDADVSPTLISKVTDAIIDREPPGVADRWIISIPLLIWTVLSLRCIRISGLSINRCTSRWVSIWKDKRNV